MIKKNTKHNKLKILVFNLFAKKMRQRNIEWVVIGGLNNYPEIGRDLDIVIEDKKKINKAIKIFKSCLKKYKIEKIIYKNDFYGNIILAFDNNFNYYEIHFCPNKTRAGFFSSKVYWNNLKSVGNFKIDPISYAFKNYFSARKPKVKLLNTFKIKNPIWLKIFLDFKKNKENINFIEYIIVSIVFIITNPFTTIINLFEWFFKRAKQMKYVHAKAYYLTKNNLEKQTIQNVNQYFLKNWFRGTKEIEKCSITEKLFLKIYGDKKKFIFSKFIFSIFFFFISLNKNFTKFQMSFLYTKKKHKEYNLFFIKSLNKKRNADEIVKGLKN